jgi:glycosyltransferase involved in cell wall biosynthesis
MPAVYAALDIAALSSAWGEGFPNALGEAMACGISCAATDSGDTHELIGNTGIVVPRRDPEALAAAWHELIALGPQGRRALGAKARARIIRHFDLGMIVARYETLYHDIVFPGSATRVPRPAESSDAERRPAFEPTEASGQ